MLEEFSSPTPGITRNALRRSNTFVSTKKNFTRGTKWSFRHSSAARSPLDEYLDRTVFYRDRSFTRGEFRDYMFSLSQPKTDVLAFARSPRQFRQIFHGTINNESRELNLHRIEKFGLREIFRLFVSSCFVGLRKPESGIYRLALETTQINPEQCCFIDDRALNLECAAKLGMKTIQMETLEQLREESGKLGVG